MSWGFVRGHKYNRRADIHKLYGGQMQGGIITPSDHNVIFIMSGKRGEEFGYDDRFHADGLIEYFGEGQVGDMQMIRGNKAIANHVENGKSLLLFEKEYPARTITFLGELVCQGWHWEESRDSQDTLRKAIVFELRQLEDIVESVDASPTPADDLEALRKLAMEAAAPSAPGGTTNRNIYTRSAQVKAYVLARAKGHCQGCEQPAPFLRPDGKPYLEPHHIRRASDGGPDDPRFVIALCPNCHRRVHSGADGPAYNATLLDRMKTIAAHD